MATTATATTLPSIREPLTASITLPLSASTSPAASATTHLSEDDDAPPPHLHPRSATSSSRPALSSRKKSSGSIIVSTAAAIAASLPPTMILDDDADLSDHDVRNMSPRRSSAELDELSEAARKDLIEQARVLQMSLQAIVERVESVKSEHERLEGGNKFLQSYIGELMQTSKITSAAPLRKGKGRGTK